MMTFRNLLRIVLPATLLAAAASTAAAQPTAATPAAPATHDWNDVSHINGQLVPVGTSNSYVKKFRRTNISTNPIGLIVGFYGVSASYAINDHIAIRGDLNYISPVDSDTVGSEFGVGLPIYLRRTYQGPFVEPGLIRRETHSESSYQCSGCGSNSDTDTGPQVLVGWHWTWDSGLNLAAAFGAGRDLDNDESEYDSALFVNGYFRVGYAF